MPSIVEETKDALIIQCTNNFIELTATSRKDHQVLTFLRNRHNLFQEDELGEPASYQEVLKNCQISDSELRDIFA